MKTITKFLVLISPAILLSASVANAQCTPGYTWNQPANNVVGFTNTSTPIIPNSTFFYWNFGDNQYDYVQNPTHTYNNPGTYLACLTMFDSLSGCQVQFCDSVTVFGNVLCSMTVGASVVQNATCATCPDGIAYAMTANGTAPYSYLWSNNTTQQYGTGLAPGTYTVCVTDANGCNACGVVTINSSSSSSCQASFTNTQTQNNIMDFTSTSTGTSSSTVYSWDFGDGNYGFGTPSSNNYANPGLYVVCLTIYDSLSQCYSSSCDSVVVYGIPNTPGCNANFVIYPDSVNSNLAWIYNLSTGGPNMTYLWSWGDNTYDNVPWPSHVYSSTGSYNICLIVTDVANQCADTMCQTLLVVRLSQAAASSPYYINVLPLTVQEQVQETFSLFPNPASSELKINSDYSLQGKSYLILDLTGRKIETGLLNGGTINIESLDAGAYILQIENSKGGFSAQRFLKN